MDGMMAMREGVRRGEDCNSSPREGGVSLRGGGVAEDGAGEWWGEGVREATSSTSSSTNSSIRLEEPLGCFS